ncbi:hypothetical protein, partial [Synechococcus sp. F70.1]|uniref:hypothetical protein n=1 Tax=Synechococcus sp. F70.1 TaxID=2964532 RepID=UPI0039C6AF57
MGLLFAQGTTTEEVDVDELEELFGNPEAKTGVSSDTVALAGQSAQDPFADDTLYERPLLPPPLRLIDSPRSPRLTIHPTVKKRIRPTPPVGYTPLRRAMST